MAFYTTEELKNIGFSSIGKNVLISNKCSIYNAENIDIGSNVRIDDFCILSAGSNGIIIGNYVHIACYVSLIGQGKIIIKDFVGISMKSTVLSSTDDFSGNFLVGPTIPKLLLNIHSADVIFQKHSLIGAHCLVLPGITIGEGTAVGAMSMINKNLEDWNIYAGTPLKIIKKRNNNLLKSVLNLNDHIK